MIIIDDAKDDALEFLLDWIGDNVGKLDLRDYGDALIHARLLRVRCRVEASAIGYAPRAFFKAVEGSPGIATA